MIFMVTGRAWGKTTKLVEYAERNGLDIVTFSPTRANQLRKQYPKFPNEFLAYTSVLKGRDYNVGYNRRNYCIDDLDIILERIFAPGCRMITASGLRHPYTRLDADQIEHVRELFDRLKKNMSDVEFKREIVADYEESIPRCKSCAGPYGHCSCD